MQGKCRAFELRKIQAAHVFKSVSVAVNWRYALIALETMFQVALQRCREMHH
jgi:hypothetical protein